MARRNKYQRKANTVVTGARRGSSSDATEEAKRVAFVASGQDLVDALASANSKAEAREIVKRYKADLRAEYDWRSTEGRKLAVEAVATLISGMED